MPTLEEVTELREELTPELTEEKEEEETAEETAEETVTEEKKEDVEYFNELPAAMGWTPDDFYKLKLKTDTGEIYTWSEIKDKLQQTKQNEQSINDRETALSTREQQLQQHTQQQGPLDQAVVQAQQDLAAINQAYNTTLGGLAALEQENDTDGLVKAQSELLRLQNLSSQANQQLNIANQTAQQQQVTAFQTYKTQQSKQLAAKLPVFGSPETRETAVTDLREYLLGEGIQPQEIANVTDARSITLFYKAMQWDKHQKNVKQTAQTLRDGTVKRIIKGKPVGTTLSSDKIAKTIARAKKSHSESDKRAAFRAVAADAGILDLGNS